MRLLAISTPNDQHAALALFALRRNGYDASFWCPADMPLFERASIHLGGAETGRPNRLIVDRREFGAFDTVLFRKYASAQLPDDMHPADRAVAQREFRYFIDGCFSLVAPNGFWANPWISLFASGKVAQLKVAAELGMKIPPTLISCDPSEIRDFVARAGPGGVIFKSFAPALWVDGAGRSMTAMTAELTAEVLQDDAALSHAPAIYQHKIAKSHELRVTMFGGFGVFARLDSQANPFSALDWRAGGSALPVEPMAADERLRSACAKLMKRLDLNFGCFDFIVDELGDIIFLEVNPAGQFLWLEEINPDIRLLAPFCAFLTQGAEGWRPDRSAAFPALADISGTAELEKFTEAFESAHAAPQSSFLVRE